MTSDDDIDGFIDKAAVALRLPVDPAWKPSIKANLKATLAHARLIEEFKLPDEAEPAPIFRA